MDEESILSEEEWQEQWLSRLEIDLTKVRRQSCNWGGYLFCCRDEEKDCFYLGVAGCAADAHLVMLGVPIDFGVWVLHLG